MSTDPVGRRTSSRLSQSRRPIRVVIVDDHEISRLGMQGCLAGLADFACVGEAGRIDDALRVVRRKKPRLLLLDVRLPDGDGIESIPRFREISARLRIVVSSIYTDGKTLRSALAAGADGFIYKGVSRCEVIGVLRACVARPDNLPPYADRFLAGNDDMASPDAQERFQRLTPREREVAYYVCVGLTNAEIGAILGIASGTVKINVERLITKLGVQNRTQVAVAVERYGPHRLAFTTADPT